MLRRGVVLRHAMRFTSRGEMEGSGQDREVTSVRLARLRLETNDGSHQTKTTTVIGGCRQYQHKLVK
jgi:hypothetical protein